MNRILWADDEIDLLKPYVIFLNQKGYEVVTASNGVDALEIVKSQSFDIVFLDENMPGLSGLETLTEIKSAHPSLPIVMITKSEEENIMNQAIGEKIADYLIKPVNPSQILMTLKKHIHQRQIVEEHNTQNYQQEFSDITYMIDTANTLEEFVSIQKTLTRWDLNLQNGSSSMKEMLELQRRQANITFAKFIQRNYQSLINQQGKIQLSHQIFKNKIFPLLDNGDKLFFVVIDNFRYDQWKTIEPLISRYFTIDQDDIACSILPTATAYARNSIFSGLMPMQIKQMYPQYWVEEDDEDGKNLKEKELIQTQLDRYRKRYQFTYNKINESDYCEKVIGRLKSMQSPLNVVVVNFIDMLSHSRTESKMMRELVSDESAYRSLTKSWFEHSPTIQLFERISKLGYKIVLTTDHGTINVKSPVLIVGDKNTNTNLRYKVGKALSCKSKDVFTMTNPQQYGLPSPNLSSSYVFCTNDEFFSYPNNFNYYAQHYKDTFQHGGISLEEMLVPLITMSPKGV